MGKNWRTQTIAKLQERRGMSETQAVSYYNQVYRLALKETSGKVKGMKVSREIYASLFYQGEQLFTIDNDGTSVVLNPIAKGSKNVEETMRLARMNKFFDKYGKSEYLKEVLAEYNSGNIDKEEFNEKIKAFKKYNIKYLISGSH